MRDFLQEVGAAISTSLANSLLLKEQACFLPLSPDGTPAIGPVPGTARSLYVASGIPFRSKQKPRMYMHSEPREVAGFNSRPRNEPLESGSKQP